MKVIEGDITDINLLDTNNIGAIVHGCNIRKTMGAGLALQIRKVFPSAFLADAQFALEGLQRLGKYSYSKENIYFHYYHEDKDMDLIIGNLYQQDLFGDGVKLQIDKLQEALTSFVNDFSDKKIAVPWGIGCSLAGGSWDEVRPMVESVLKETDSIWVKLPPASP